MEISKPRVFVLENSVVEIPIMEKSKWWNIFTNKLSDKLNMDFKDMKFLGYFDLDACYRKVGVSPSDCLFMLNERYTNQRIKFIIINGYFPHQGKFNNGITLKKYFENNPYLSTESYFKKIGLI